jgi:hypothetical protein
MFFQAKEIFIPCFAVASLRNFKFGSNTHQTALGPTGTKALKHPLLCLDGGKRAEKRE